MGVGAHHSRGDFPKNLSMGRITGETPMEHPNPKVVPFYGSFKRSPWGAGNF